MSDPVFVVDANQRPLMPISAAYARKLIKRNKARWLPHYAFRIIQLGQTVDYPNLRPVVVGIAINATTAELFLIAEGTRATFPLLSIAVDLHTDLHHRLRRRAAHRRRRRNRGRYRQIAHYGVPFKLRRPNFARSAWGSTYRKQRSKVTGQSQPRLTPTLQWRVQALHRAIDKLKQIVPISHIAILSPLRSAPPHFNSLTPAERRAFLMHVYAQPIGKRQYQAVCAYCSRYTDDLEVEHIVPRSRGGSNGWHNVILSCRLCNQLKADRTPAEAGMILRYQPLSQFIGSSSRQILVRQTAIALYRNLKESALTILWQRSLGEQSELLSPETHSLFLSWVQGSESFHALWVAKPIARLRKQHFFAHNYSITTPINPSYVRIGQTIKRRVEVNRGLVLWRDESEVQTQVLRSNDPTPTNAQIVKRGMLCEAQRAGRTFRGIVSAIQSSGRLTLLVPRKHNNAIFWDRIVISPRKHFRILSNDGVVFLKLDANTPEVT